MEKLKIQNFKQLINRLNNTSISIEITGIIGVNFDMHKIKAIYDKEEGTIKIIDNITNKTISIEKEAVYIILQNERKDVFQMGVDNDENVKITVYHNFK